MTLPKTLRNRVPLQRYPDCPLPNALSLLGAKTEFLERIATDVRMDEPGFSCIQAWPKSLTPFRFQAAFLIMGLNDIQFCWGT